MPNFVESLSDMVGRRLALAPRFDHGWEGRSDRPRRASRMALGAVTLVAALHSHPTPLWGQVLRGRVLDDATDGPVAGALMMLTGSGGIETHAVSGEGGVFEMTLERPGVYSLRVIRLGYQQTTIPVIDLQSGQSVVDVDILLAPRPLGIEGVVVSAVRYQSDIEALGLRVEDLGDRLITRDQLDGMGFRDVGSALERYGLAGGAVTRGENVSDMAGGGVRSQRLPLCVRLARARGFDGSQRCALLFLDQAIVVPEVIDALSPSELEAIVVLTPSEAVQRFGTLGGSGAILLYSRRGR